MKKLKRILPIITFVVLLVFSSTFAYAKDIKSINTETKDGALVITGQAEDGVLAVSVFVYDKTGTKLLKMESKSVGSDHKYEDTIEIEAGEYFVKVADYEGGKFATAKVTVVDKGLDNTEDDDDNKKPEKQDNDSEEKKDKTDEDNESKEDIINTGDSSLAFVFAGLMLISMTSLFVIKKKYI